jgi:hypothetical protein
MIRGESEKGKRREGRSTTKLKKVRETLSTPAARTDKGVETPPFSSDAQADSANQEANSSDSLWDSSWLSPFCSRLIRS